MSQKKQKKLEQKISEIIIVNNKKLAPYIEIVNANSRNIDQRQLGTILGIFEIKDTSEDSSYIVNFLASVAKKTYFNGKKKTVIDSFEATLSRINLSLSELARHGNINWIGKIDAVICSVGNNQINFSVSGDAKILLLRDRKLIDISSNLSPKDEAINPLKTFTDIASGRLEDGDKLILTTDDISHIFTPSDLENYALSFSNKKFIRFLKTALVNELEIAGTIIIDVFEKTILPKKTLFRENTSSSKKLNAFSSATFEKKHTPKKTVEISSHKKTAQKNKNSKNDTSSKENSIDKISEKKDNLINNRTGHIYLKSSTEERVASSQENQFNNWLIFFQEKLFEFSLWLKNRYIHKGCYKIKKYFIPLFKNTPKKVFALMKKNIFSYSHKLKSTSNTIFKKSSKKNITFDKAQPINVDKDYEKSQAKTSLSAKKKNSLNVSRLIKSFSKKIHSIFSLAINLLPRPNIIKTTFKRMNRRQRIYAIIILLAIFILPLFFTRLVNKKQTNETVNSLSVDNDQNAPIVESTSNHHLETTQLYEDDNLFGIFTFNGSVFAISKNKLTKIQDNDYQNFLFPNYFGKLVSYSFMSDLNLLFLLDENKKLISFSPISRKFRENNINVPEDSTIGPIGTYLTYIYLVDIKNNQIYRYPRAEGGFGEKVSWLKEGVDLKDTTTIAIDENIFLLTSDNIVLKLTKGKLQAFGFKANDKMSIKNIFTNDDSAYIYILDNSKGDIIKFDKNGNYISSIYNKNLSKADDFWIDEKNNLIYFTANKKLFKVDTSKIN